MKQKILTACITAAFFITVSVWVSGCKKENENPSSPGANQPELRVSNSNPLVYTPVASMFGKSYTQWGVEFWKWEVGFDCSSIFGAGVQPQNFPGVFILQQSGNVTIPSNLAILVSAGTVIDDYPCVDTSFHPAPGETLEHFLTRDAIAVDGAYSNQTVIIDGNTITGMSNYHIVSPMFNFTGNHDLVNCLDPCITGTVQQGVVVGTFVMIKPLSIGTHTIHISVDYAGITYGVDYTITSN